eukprot:gnl/MRDRNA2_/MRDRNA2_72961_c0_seq1.p1 gnl/MRDRNA2_/MRDRNA2_72961_c0~~gnl/MRDRNA2_/MRDRNA2_72961_c0_seq1.p1  ORF type:complete len:226 (+),score=11.32 gnl/MRDRNA2_/MRDRNA2_72961_c0_seq1:50-679(+)
MTPMEHQQAHLAHVRQQSQTVPYMLTTRCEPTKLKKQHAFTMHLMSIAFRANKQLAIHQYTPLQKYNSIALWLIRELVMKLTVPTCEGSPSFIQARLPINHAYGLLFLSHGQPKKKSYLLPVCMPSTCHWLLTKDCVASFSLRCSIISTCALGITALKGKREIVQSQPTPEVFHNPSSSHSDKQSTVQTMASNYQLFILQNVWLQQRSQ